VNFQYYLTYKKHLQQNYLNNKDLKLFGLNDCLPICYFQYLDLYFFVLFIPMLLLKPNLYLL